MVAGLGVALAACNQQQPDTDTVAVDAAAGSPEQAAAAGAAETLHLIPPNGWTLVSSSNRGDFRRAEYLRDAGAAYRETLTAEAFPAEDQPDPLAFLDALAADEQERCAGFSRHPIFAGEERGFATVVEVHRCPQRRVNNQAAVRLLKVIQGQVQYVVLTLAKEGAATRDAKGWATTFTTEEDMATWALYLKQAYLQAGDQEDTEKP